MPELRRSKQSSRLLSTSGSFGEIAIVALPDAIVIDAATRNYDVAGHCHHDHATASLSLSAAEHLRDLLSEAIEHAASARRDTRQTALWSDITTSRRIGALA